MKWKRIFWNGWKESEPSKFGFLSVSLCLFIVRVCLMQEVAWFGNDNHLDFTLLLLESVDFGVNLLGFKSQVRYLLRKHAPAT